MSLCDRIAFLGRTFRGLICEPRMTWKWLWGGCLQFTPLVLWLSPKRRRVVAEVDRMRADERHVRQVCREATRDALNAEMDDAIERVGEIAHLFALIPKDVAIPSRRPRTARPPNRLN